MGVILLDVLVNMLAHMYHIVDIMEDVEVRKAPFIGNAYTDQEFHSLMTA